jgi:hypothetical protein
MVLLDSAQHIGEHVPLHHLVLVLKLEYFSHLCARIASAGKVVVVMEHRDGSGLFCLSKSPGTGKRDPLPYIKPGDTSCVLTIHAPPG